MVEHGTENAGVASSTLALGTAGIHNAFSERKWLSGRASPCQGEGRGFESHLPLQIPPKMRMKRAHALRMGEKERSDMLTPEDFEEFRPKFEEIYELLYWALVWSHGKTTYPDAACGAFLAASERMEALVEEIEKREGSSLRDRLKQVVAAINPAERAGLGGAAGGAGAAYAVTHGLGFGIATGGSAFGIAGVTGGVVASGGTALAGAAAAYLLYKAYDQWGDSDSELGKKVREAAPTLGGAAAEAAKQTTRRVKERFKRNE